MTVEAEQERELLPEYFVDIEGYERVRGAETLLVFAPRGSGKSALRVMLAAQAAPIREKSPILTIECIDFDELVKSYVLGNQLRIEEYVGWLLRTGLRKFLKTIGHAVENEEGSTIRARLLGPVERMHLAGLLRVYGGSLLNLESVFERLSLLDPAFISKFWLNDVVAARESEISKPTILVLDEAITNRKMGMLIKRTVLNGDPVAELMADLIDLPRTDTVSLMTMTEAMILYISIARKAGFDQVQFLVDCLDETQETADDPTAQCDILEPIVSHLPILELPDVAFKFFIPKETRDELVKRPTFRRDRLMDQMITVKWDEKRLEHLLIERLKVFSEEGVQDLSLLFSKSRVDLDVVKEMISMAEGSPRHLLRAGKELFSAHIAHYGPVGMFEADDWDRAKHVLSDLKPEDKVGAELFSEFMPEPTSDETDTVVLGMADNEVPPLRLTDISVFLGDKEVSLSPLEYNFLKALIDLDGEGRQMELIDRTWSNDVEPNEKPSLHSLVRRLREKLDDRASAPKYIKTIHGHGYRLVNFLGQSE